MSFYAMSCVVRGTVPWRSSLKRKEDDHATSELTTAPTPVCQVFADSDMSAHEAHCHDASVKLDKGQLDNVDNSKTRMIHWEQRHKIREPIYLLK